MSLFNHDDDVDLSKVKPIPYEDDDQNEQQSQDNTPPLNRQQKAYLKKIAEQGAIDSLVSDSVTLNPDLPPPLPDTDKPADK